MRMSWQKVGCCQIFRVSGTFAPVDQCRATDHQTRTMRQRTNHTVLFTERVTSQSQTRYVIAPLEHPPCPLLSKWAKHRLITSFYAIPQASNKCQQEAATQKHQSPSIILTTLKKSEDNCKHCSILFCTTHLILPDTKRKMKENGVIFRRTGGQSAL